MVMASRDQKLRFFCRLIFLSNPWISAPARLEWMFPVECDGFLTIWTSHQTSEIFFNNHVSVTKKKSCLHKISWKSTWTLFDPQRSIFVQFFDTRARFTSQRHHLIIRNQPKVRFVSENHTSRRSQSYRPRARTYFWGLRGTLWTEIGLKPALEARITTRNVRVARGRCWSQSQSPHLSLNEQYWAQQIKISIWDFPKKTQNLDDFFSESPWPKSCHPVSIPVIIDRFCSFLVFL